MTQQDLRQKFFEFWTQEPRKHVVIPSSSLVPENDPTTLFTGSGMQPLIPYLLGQKHPEGTRLVDIQKCFRSQDIEEIGDNRHHTFFEMLGNWSLGDYFKKEQLSWYWEFLTKVIGFDPNRLYVSCFEGSPEAPRDDESASIWKSLGVEEGHIRFYGVKKNWWSRSGTPSEMPVGEIGGPDSEVFYDFGAERKIHENSPFSSEECHPNCDCGRFLEIGNSVFIQYIKQPDGSFKELEQKNVDFGGGFERMLAAINDDPDDFATDLFSEIISEIEQSTGKKYEGENKVPMRVIADHVKSATFLIKDGVVPSNKDRGYVLRRLLRRAQIKIHSLGGGLTSLPAFKAITIGVIKTYSSAGYFDEAKDQDWITKIVEDEINKFGDSLDRGLKEFEKITSSENSGLAAFNLFQSFGFPVEVTEELLKQKGITLNKEEFNNSYRSHQDMSREASQAKFKGGLADHSDIVVKYHTATHLLQAALRQVLGDQVHQEGSNLTAERLRFDFSHGQKLTPEEIKKVEDIVNEQIKNGLERKVETMTYDEAMASGALAFFKEKYPEKVTVFSFGDFSKELCGGPHVENTSTLGTFRIIKEESVSAGTRRLYAQLS